VTGGDKDPVSDDDAAALQDEHEHEQPRGDVYIDTREGLVGRRVPRHRVGRGHGEPLVRPEEELLRGPADAGTCCCRCHYRHRHCHGGVTCGNWLPAALTRVAAAAHYRLRHQHATPRV
jgi:hypothetical protein